MSVTEAIGLFNQPVHRKVQRPVLVGAALLVLFAVLKDMGVHVSAETTGAITVLVQLLVGYFCPEEAPEIPIAA